MWEEVALMRGILLVLAVGALMVLVLMLPAFATGLGEGPGRSYRQYQKEIHPHRPIG